MLIACNEHNGHCLTFRDGVHISDRFLAVWMLQCICVKTVTAVTAMYTCLFNNRLPSYRYQPTVRLSMSVY